MAVFMAGKLVIVHDLDLGGAAVGPHEAEAVLVVDADGVLALPVAAQRLEPVAGRNTEIVESTRHVELAQLAAGNMLDGGRNLPTPAFAIRASVSAQRKDRIIRRGYAARHHGQELSLQTTGIAGEITLPL
jgi:hypothetical protein